MQSMKTNLPFCTFSQLMILSFPKMELWKAMWVLIFLFQVFHIPLSKLIFFFYRMIRMSEILNVWKAVQVGWWGWFPWFTCFSYWALHLLDYTDWKHKRIFACSEELWGNLLLDYFFCFKKRLWMYSLFFLKEKFRSIPMSTNIRSRFWAIARWYMWRNSICSNWRI